MDRRSFITYASILGSTVALQGSRVSIISREHVGKRKNHEAREMCADVIVIGGGLGGCAAALACCRNGLDVIMTEKTDWIGGQVSQQGAPPNEHQWIETYGAPQSYRDFRNRVRDYYRRDYPLTKSARERQKLNPGDGSVSRICHEPKVTVSVLTDMLSPYLSSGKLQILKEHKSTNAQVIGDNVQHIEVENLRSGNKIILTGDSFVDATECGDLLLLTNTEYVTGTESKHDTGELHAPEKADTMNNQAFTICFAMDYQPGKDNIQDPSKEYDFWKNYVPEMTSPFQARKRCHFAPSGKIKNYSLNFRRKLGSKE